MISNETNYFPILNIINPCEFTKDATLDLNLQYQTAYITFKDKSKMDSFNKGLSTFADVIYDSYPDVDELYFICKRVADEIATKLNIKQITLHDYLHLLSVSQRDKILYKGRIVMPLDDFINIRNEIRNMNNKPKEENTNMSKRLVTIQKREKLNEVYSVDSKGPGGAYHEYSVMLSDEYLDVEIPKLLASIQFQKGPRKEANSQHGVIDSDLLEIVRDRLTCFQEGEFASEYNAKALEHIEIALMYLNRRVEDRIERNVLGTNEK